MINIGYLFLTFCKIRSFAEEPRQVDHKYAILRNQQHSGYKCFIPRTLITHDTYVPYLYSDEDIEKIFEVADSLVVTRATKNRYVEKEMPLFLRLLYCCGLRVGETVSIKVGDLDFDRNLIILRVTKKYKQRLVPFGKDLADANSSRLVRPFQN